MALFQFSEAQERAAIGELLKYVVEQCFGSSDTITHRHDSHWEHVCRVFALVDPSGTRPLGYVLTRPKDQYLEIVSQRAITRLPTVEAFLDLALAVCNYRHGIEVTHLSGPIAYQPDLERILRKLELIDHSGLPSDALILDAIHRWKFFDPNSRAFPQDVDRLIENAAGRAWATATKAHRAEMTAAAGKGLDSWLGNHWRFGVWFNALELERNDFCMGTHSALAWQVAVKLETGIRTGRLLP